VLKDQVVVDYPQLQKLVLQHQVQQLH
jgi:hypothetical protein